MSNAAVVRAWAKEQGIEVGIRGRLAPEIFHAYAKMVDDPEGSKNYTPRSSVVWACDCGREWVGLSQCHCARCHRHFSTVTGFDAHLIVAPGHNPDGRSICGDPLTVTNRRTGNPKWIARDGRYGPIIVEFKPGGHWKTTEGDGIFDETD